MNGGCPNDAGREKETLQYTLIDFIDVSPEDLVRAGHLKGPQCRCRECARLKDLEDKWILRLGTFYGDGLNSRDEVQSKLGTIGAQTTKKDFIHWGQGRMYENIINHIFWGCRNPPPNNPATLNPSLSCGGEYF